jgi:membrane-associated phospholipid phosphatase
VDRRPLLAAGTCVALAGLVYLLVCHVAFAQRVDSRVLADAMAHRTPGREDVASGIVSLFNPVPFVVLASLIVAAAIAAGRVRAGLVVGASMVASAASAEWLKPLLAVQRQYPDYHYMPAASWPSAHTAAIVSLLLGLVILLPPRLRPTAAALCGGFGLLALGSIVLMGFHYPSDVLGGVLVATAWSAVALALSGTARAPRAARPRPRSPRATG